MSQYHYDRPPTAAVETAAPDRAQSRDNDNEIRRMRELIQQQQSMIDRLHRDLRHLRNRVDQHAYAVNRINRG